jgi:hypothetical protein
VQTGIFPYTGIILEKIFNYGMSLVEVDEFAQYCAFPTYAENFSE